MKKSPLGLDTIELTKRHRQHKADLQHLKDSEYLTFKERCFQMRKKKLQFEKSLKSSEIEFIQELVVTDLGGLPNE